MLQLRSKAFTRRQKKNREGTSNEKVNAVYETTDAQTKKDLQKRNCLRTVSRKAFGMGRPKPVLFARNMILNYDANPNYKHIRSAKGFSTSSLKHRRENIVMISSIEHSDQLKPEHKKTTNRKWMVPTSDI